MVMMIDPHAHDLFVFGHVGIGGFGGLSSDG